ncbi:MAG: hypothetical protein KF817_03920 [Phycisphaeraceae bacterium]|nr:hypothetical protein [Phycisphaeraceae bacterium]
MALAVMAASAGSFAQQDRVSASEKGSLLVWSKVEVVYQVPPQTYDPALDYPYDLQSFSLEGAPGGPVDVFSAFYVADGTEVGFSFAGMYSETAGASWASDTRLRIFRNGDLVNMIGGFNDPGAPWDFQGSFSTPPGPYAHGVNGVGPFANGQPDWSFGTLVQPGDVWLFEFSNGWDSAQTITWSDAILTMHKASPSSTALVQDTIITLTNDYPEDVAFQMYFIQGDNTNPLGYWQVSDVGIELTRDQPVSWSAATGQGTVNVTPWSVLGPGIQDGTRTIYRGMIVGWAVDRVTNRPIRHNHLAGQGTVVNYGDASAYEYSTWAFASNQASHGQPLPIAPNADGSITMSLGTSYAPSYAQLLLNFQSTGSSAWSSNSAMVVSDTDLTLHPMDWDLRENTSARPVVTKAQFDVWNENETKFSGAYRCILCWDQTLLSSYGVPNHFSVGSLQTNHGKARIDGVASPLCDGIPSSGDLSVAASLLGISARFLSIDSESASAAASLVGMGQENATITYFPGSGPPDEAPAMNVPAVSFDRMMKSILRR